MGCMVIGNHRRDWVGVLLMVCCAAVFGACGSATTRATEPESTPVLEAAQGTESLAQPDEVGAPAPEPVVPRRMALAGGISVVREPLRVAAPAAQEYLDARPRQWAVAVAVPASGRLLVENADTPFPMASLTKVPLMLTYLDWVAQQAREPDEDELSLLEGMIEYSDNGAADVLWEAMGGGPAMDAFLRRSAITGIRSAPNGAWGDSTATAVAMVRLFSHIAARDLLSEPSSELALQLLTHIGDDQRWGVPVALAGRDAGEAVVATKNGWYPATTGWRVSSAGMSLHRDGTVDLIAVVMTRNQESQEAAIETIEGVSARVRLALDDADAGIPVGAPAPLPAALTQVTRFSVSSGARPEVEGTCFAASIRVLRQGAYRCTAGQELFDPCFADPDDPDGAVICEETPVSAGAGIRLRLTDELPAVSRSASGNPWFLVLADGVECTFNGVDSPVDEDSERDSYSCTGGAHIWGAIQRGDVWSVRKTDLLSGLSADVYVVEAWF